MVQNVMVRQRILLTGNFREKRERNSASGYILDYDPSPLSPKEHGLAIVDLATLDLNGLVELAFKEASSICRDLLGISVPTIGPDTPLKLVKAGAPQRKSIPSPKDYNSDSSSDEEDVLSDGYQSVSDAEGSDAESGINLGNLTASAAHSTARYSALCEDFEDAVAESESNAKPVVFGPSPPPNPNAVAYHCSTPKPVPARLVLTSDLLDDNSTVSISRMLGVRRKMQSQTSTHSERTVELDKKFALRKVADEAGKTPKMTPQEASHRVRIGQTMAGLLEKEKKYREVRWKTAAKSLRDILTLQGLSIFTLSLLFH
jgi:hypothetical protein